jgi:hypothetical protein
MIWSKPMGPDFNDEDKIVVARILAGHVSQAQWDANPAEHWRLEEADQILTAVASRIAERARMAEREATVQRIKDHGLFDDDWDNEFGAARDYF